MNALKAAARAAAEEAARLLADARHALTLESESDALYDRATGAIEAYKRAWARADQLRKLAEHHSGGYNVWKD